MNKVDYKFYREDSDYNARFTHRDQQGESFNQRHFEFKLS